MPNFLTYYNDHSASIYSQELFQKRYTQYHKKKRSGYIGKCSPCKDIRSLFSGGCQIYIQYRRKWKFYRRNVKLCLPWERYVLAIKRVLFNVIRQVSSSFFFILSLIINTPYYSRSPSISISCRFYLVVTVRWMFCCSLESQENGKRLSELECTLSRRLLFD